MKERMLGSTAGCVSQSGTPLYLASDASYEFYFKRIENKGSYGYPTDPKTTTTARISGVDVTYVDVVFDKQLKSIFHFDN